MTAAPAAPMEALLAAELPAGPEWQYEPKWDGFRCLALRDGDKVELWSKSGKPLGRYFPEIVAMVGRLKSDRFLLDGELIIVTAGGLSFDALQMRLHPAESRVRKLAAETPALLMAFDLLELDGTPLAERALTDRRVNLERFLGKQSEPMLLLSPTTTDRDQALGWLARSGGALDGVVAKRRDQPYREGERAMVKVKQHRTADCVVGGFRYDSAGAAMASLLLGLYDDQGRLNHVGFCSSFKAAEKKAWTPELQALIESPGFTGDKPDVASRWARDRVTEWQPLRPELVVEVLYDQVTGGRFRHGTRLLRRRPDKRPDQCRCEQLRHPLTPAELDGLLGR
ncbi:ATP-dependent DNA ligase [Sphingomonas sp. BN140010]|uniref:DNA ligase (ATP) n=1 Tax=Sphingomonas arvum TaxID=2992113 RepID=A0ABT3JAX0_9SPHN|nr:ATP-dependent DNA ligase [Sphingomonas sp. BN140010]MCW3796200.1 ATP-dependent DNA ligase [Sphingomonas sp. BN140010]